MITKVLFLKHIVRKIIEKRLSADFKKLLAFSELKTFCKTVQC